MKQTLFAIIMALLWTCCPVQVLQSCAESPAAPIAPFDAELYNLGYDVFLANGNLRDAFALAENAVAVRPNDVVWRRRAAQTGEWSGNFAHAFEHWFYLATVMSDPDAKQPAIRLARELREFSRLKYLMESELKAGNENALREYISVCELLGLPEDAIAAMELRRAGKDVKDILEQLARIYEATGHTDNAIAAWLEQSARYGATAPVLLKAASMAYGKGDVQSAYTILNLGRKSMPPRELEYWATLSDLDWALQYMKGASMASRVLVKQGKGRDVDYQRLIAVSRNTDKAETYALALEGWLRFKSAPFFYVLVETGIELNHQDELVLLILDADREGVLKPLEEFSYYWMLRSRIQRATGDIAASISNYQEAMRRAPDNGALAAGYIWLLLDLDRRTELRETLQNWRGREKNMPELYDSFGAAFALLGEHSRALNFFRARYRKMRNDPVWLAAYADILEQTGSPDQAFLERIRALELVRARMKQGATLAEDDRKELMRVYARLAMQIEPGDVLDEQMKKIMRGKQDDITRELVSAWALTTERSDLARLWYLREYASMARRPGWVELALAMEENDHDRIARLISQDRELLPYRDTIEGLLRVGRTPDAETLAFDRLQANDQDYLLDQQVRDVFNARPGWLSYGLSLMDQGGVGFLEQQISLSYPLTQRLALKVEAGNTEIRHLKNGLLGFYPSSSKNARAGFSLRHEQGMAEASIGLYDGLSRSVMATMRTDWKLNHKQSLDLALRVGAEASETVLLKIGGLKDEVSVGLQNAFSSRDSLLLRFSARSLRDQDRRELGEGASFESELTHRLLMSQPDTNLRLFAGYHHYARSAKPSGKALRLIPGEIADAAYYVPSSFTQTGIGINVGQEGRTSYIRHWRPFGALDTNWNSVSGLGYHYEVGLVGPVFGLDKLEGAFSQDSGSFGTSDMTSRFDLRYRYHFD